MSMTSEIAIAKILDAIKRNGGIATVTKIKNSIAEFNQRRGGADRLRQYLDKLVANGTLTSRKDKVGKGQAVESYSLANSNINGGSNNCTNGSSTNDGNLSIAVTLDIILDRLMEIVHSLLNVDDGNGNDDSDSSDSTDEYIDEYGEEYNEEGNILPFGIPYGDSDVPDDDDTVPF